MYLPRFTGPVVVEREPVLVMGVDKITIRSVRPLCWYIINDDGATYVLDINGAIEILVNETRSIDAATLLLKLQEIRRCYPDIRDIHIKEDA